jgi:hypothetical protein
MFSKTFTENVIENVLDNVHKNVLKNFLKNALEDALENALENVFENVLEKLTPWGVDPLRSRAPQYNQGSGCPFTSYLSFSKWQFAHQLRMNSISEKKEEDKEEKEELEEVLRKKKSFNWKSRSIWRSLPNFRSIRPQKRWENYIQSDIPTDRQTKYLLEALARA